MRDGTYKNIALHRLMLIIYNKVPGYENLIVNHKDGIKYHNWLWNLEWTDYVGNTKHALENGLFKKGEEVSYATINNKQADVIAKLLSEGFRPTEIARQLEGVFPNGAHVKQIAIDIANGQSWKHITEKYDMRNCYKFHPNERIFNDEQVSQICAIFQKYGNKVPYNVILDYIGYDYSDLDKHNKDKLSAIISQIRKKKYRAEICNKYNY